MNYPEPLKRFIGLLMCGLACLLIYGCSDDDCPTCPHQSRDYVFYLYDENPEGSYFYAYHSRTGHLDTFYSDCRYHMSAAASAVDTIPCLSARFGLVVSPDGSRLYCCPGGGVSVVDSGSFEPITWLEYNSRYGADLSPDGSLLAIFGSQSLIVVKTSDWSVVYHDTIAAFCGDFSDDCTWLLTGRSSYIEKIDVSSAGRSSVATPVVGRPTKLRLTADGNKWLLYTQVYPNGFRFQVLGMPGDSLLYGKHISPGWGDLQLSSSGRLVFVSNPGQFMVQDIVPPLEFIVFDVALNTIRTIVSTGELFDQYGERAYVPVGNMAVTPDGRTMVAVGGPLNPWFIVMDVSSAKITQCIRTSPSSRLFSIACQTQR